MRLLIAYDGTDGSDAALDDSKRAGFPQKGEAVVLCISDLPLPPTVTAPDVNMSVAVLQASVAQIESARELALRTAREGARRFGKVFTQWNVRAEAETDSPAAGLLQYAHHMNPDLILVGSHGHTLLGRLLLGSVSQKLVTEARTSVRIGRKPKRIQAKRGVKILVGVDGSKESIKAIETVANREWPPESEVRLLTAVDPRLSILAEVMNAGPDPAAHLVDREGNAALWIAKVATHASERLRQKALKVSSPVRIGDPKMVLLSEAEKWEADSLFVGFRGTGAVERFLLGSVAQAVAARATCSVEVVR